MNILIYNYNEPYPKQGGMERVTDQLARILNNSGHKVILLCNCKNRLGEVYNCPVPIYFTPDVKQRTPVNQKFLLNILENEKVECIIDQCEGGIVGRFGFFRNKNRPAFNNIKLISVLHNSAKTLIDNLHLSLAGNVEKGVRGFCFNSIYIKMKKLHATILRKKLYKHLSLDYDAIVTLSSTFFEEFRFYAPKIELKKLYAIPNSNTYAAATDRFKKINEVLFVGRLDNKAKGIDRLLYIWAKVFRKFPDWHLSIVGDGPDKEKLMELAQSLKLDQVTFEGFQDPKSYYERARIFCMTSTFEGFGMVLTEAMQHGVVPLAFNSYRAVMDIIQNEENGFLIEPFNIEEYKEKLIKLISDEELRNSFSDYGKKSVEKFSIENVGKLWNSLLEKI